MIRKWLTFTLVLMLVLSSAALCPAEETEYDTLPDWGLRVAVPAGAEGVLDTGEGNYYIYPVKAGSIPYVMIRFYPDAADAGTLAETAFLDAMREQYPDLEVTEGPSDTEIGGKSCLEMKLTYSSGDYAIHDRRLFCEAGGAVYMFCSKEIEELGLTVDSLLEDVVAGCEFLTEPDGPGQQNEPPAVTDGPEQKNEPPAVTDEPEKKPDMPENSGVLSAAGGKTQTAGQDGQKEPSPGQSGQNTPPPRQDGQNTPVPGKPSADLSQVAFSEWEQTDTSEYWDEYTRDITVADGGNYLLTYAEVRGSGDPIYGYNTIWQGTGTQRTYTKDLSSVTVIPGQLFRIDTMEETELSDIDVYYTDRITVQEATGSTFILMVRMHGTEEYEGRITTVNVIDGVREFNPDYYSNLESIDLLGVLTFPPEDAEALHLGDLEVEKVGSTYTIRQRLLSDMPHGIGIVEYRNSNGNMVNASVETVDGQGLLTAYDSAESPEEIQTGFFRVLAFRGSQ